MDFEHQKYLIVVTEAKKRADIVDFNCYLASKFEFIPLSSSNAEAMASKDDKYKKMFTNFFDRETFYFSQHYDLTRTVISQAKENFTKATPDFRFFYNRHFLEGIIDGGFKEFV